MPLLVALFLIAGAVAVRRCWRGVGKAATLRGYWFLPISRAAKNALWRTVPATFSVLLLLVVMLIPVWEVSSDLFTVVIRVEAGALFFLLLSMPTIMWWNVPRFLVPPPYRKEPGLISLWRRRRAIARAAAPVGQRRTR
ncbi:hypothetical protein [Micromonospora lupini]|uniref:hypothetical protein n=1 Tax=Micromonospora lupini TaxID=285679 RepID=UPI0033CC07DE